MKTNRRIRFPIRFKTTLMVVLFGLVLAEIAMIYFSLVTSASNKEDYKSIAHTVSSIGALAVDKQEAEDLTDQVVSIFEDSGKPERSALSEDELSAYLAKFDAIHDSPRYKAMQKSLSDIRKTTKNVEGVYLGYVDYDAKLCLYVAYDADDENFPLGVADPLYEEDYPLLDDHMLGFVPSIYVDEVTGQNMVTSGSPVLDGDGGVICYCLVDISMNVVRAEQGGQIVRLFLYLVATVAALSIVSVLIVNQTLIKPVKTLQAAARSYDIENPEETHAAFANLTVRVNDEFRDLADSMRAMEGDVYERIQELTEVNTRLIEAQNEASRMHELAHKDALTGIANKIAYDAEAERLNGEIAAGTASFGIAMIDLNYLKNINDEYGHRAGDIALIRLSGLATTVFAHSTVYRIGGDEFVVLLQGKDYKQAEDLIEEFCNRIDAIYHNEELPAPERISAAIGYARFIQSQDEDVLSVFQRADEAMYERKRAMKLAFPFPKKQ